MQRDSIANILRVSVLLCLVCSIGVSVAAVLLRPRQDENKRLDVQKNVLQATGKYTPEDIDRLSSDEIASRFQENFTTHYVKLGTDEEVEQSALPDGDQYDPRAAAMSSKLQVSLPREIASEIGILTVAPYYPVYEVMEEGQLDCFVLPIFGKGLWSTMYGFLAVEPDGKTIRGIKFYEHGETPGLGGEIENPNWTSKWPGKVAINPEGEPEIQVLKGSVSPGDPLAYRRVDGLAGATITTKGVEKAVNFWLSDAGFGKFLAARSAAHQ